MINLWYEDSHFQGTLTGPQKVLRNLKDSLNLMNVPYAINEEKYEKNFLVHYDTKGHEKHERLDHNTCFIGPQFWPFDQWGQFLIENPSYYKKLIVPSQWVKDLITSKLNLESSKISVWPVGIQNFNNDNKDIQYDCLIYYKRRSQQELKLVQEFLESKNLSYNIIQYGSYSEYEFHTIASQSRFCFLLDNTESQGIATQEIMAMNLPIIAWDIVEWSDLGEDYKVPATSVPYWDSSCGEKFYDQNDMEETFNKFYDRIGEYSPSQFIESNLSFERSIQILLEILNAD